MKRLIYKILAAELWREAESRGVFHGAGIDLADGFIHLSDGAQVRQTAALYFQGQTDLVLVAVEADALGAALKWEASRGGQLFPHLYASLPVAAVAWVRPMPIGADGHHEIGEDVQ